MRSGAGVDGNGGPLWLTARAKSKWPCATRFFPQKEIWTEIDRPGRSFPWRLARLPSACPVSCK